MSDSDINSYIDKLEWYFYEEESDDIFIPASQKLASTDNQQSLAIISSDETEVIMQIFPLLQDYSKRFYILALSFIQNQLFLNYLLLH